MELKVTNENPPKLIVQISEWQPVYKKVDETRVGSWVKIDLPAERLGNALNIFRLHYKKYKTKIQMKVDKNNVDKGFATLFIRRVPKKKAINNARC